MVTTALIQARMLVTEVSNNNFGGFYFDDIIVATTERGEMVTGAEVGNTDLH